MSHSESLPWFYGYYHCFLDGYRQTAVPVMRLTKQDVSFVWTTACQRAFDTLRESLMEIPMLNYVRQGKDFILDTYASQHDIGVVLSQLDDTLMVPR